MKIKNLEGAPQPVTLVCGDNLEYLSTLADESIDAIVCDPPYGLSKEPDMAEVLRHWLAGDDYTHTGSGFMGKSWDSFVPGPATWRECLRVLRPGGHLLAFAGSRTMDLMGMAIRLAGFEMRDTLTWMYGSGFPKSLDVSKAIDKMHGAEREVVGSGSAGRGALQAKSRVDQGYRDHEVETGGSYDITAPGSPDATQWDGWGTALKPAYEPIILARKPLRVGRKKATVAANVLEHGTGALNIDATRIGYQSESDMASATPQGKVTAKSGALAGEVEDGEFVIVGPESTYWSNTDGWGDRASATRFKNSEMVTDPMDAIGREPWLQRKEFDRPEQKGRWPANVLLTHHEDCVEVGTKTVKGGSRADRGSESSGIPGSALAGSVDGSLNGQQSPGYADPDGTETIPAFDCHEECPVRLLDEQSGTIPPSARSKRHTERKRDADGVTSFDGTAMRRTEGHKDSGGASRFFYSAKVSKSERNAGLTEGTNSHPTLKPIKVMEWLIKLVTPPDGVVLDPFMGSGSTGCAAVALGFGFIGIDTEREYANIAYHRIRHHTPRAGA